MRLLHALADIHNPFPVHQLPRGGTGSHSRSRAGSFGVILALGLLALLALSDSARAYDIRLVTDNDFLGSNDTQDDLYTFGLVVEIDKGPLTWTLAENAFTDREAGLRFDETQLTVGKLLPPHLLGRWSLWLEAGVTHVGEGLFGEGVQNAFHELIGSDEVHLDYVDRSDVHAHVGFEAGRQTRIAPGLSVGPHLEAHTDIGFKADAMVGVRGRWTPSSAGPLGRLEVDVTVGGRYTDASLDLLERHVDEFAAAASVEVSTPGGLVINWTRNRYGTDREHVALGFRFGSGDSPRRSGPWRER